MLHEKEVSCNLHLRLSQALGSRALGVNLHTSHRSQKGLTLVPLSQNSPGDLNAENH